MGGKSKAFTEKYSPKDNRRDSFFTAPTESWHRRSFRMPDKDT